MLLAHSCPVTVHQEPPGPSRQTWVSSLCMFSCYPFCGLSRRCYFSLLSRLFVACSHLAALSPYAETDACIKLNNDFNISSHLLNTHVSILGFLWYCFSHWEGALRDIHFPVLFQTSPSQTPDFLQCLPNQLEAGVWGGGEQWDLSVILMSVVLWFQWTLPPAFICLLSFLIQLAHQFYREEPSLDSMFWFWICGTFSVPEPKPMTQAALRWYYWNSWYK